jgi:hypothetical protein
MLLADRPPATTPAETAALAAALANLEAAAFNLWLAANTIAAEIEHGTEDPQQLGRALRLEAGIALETLFEWRRLRWMLAVDAVSYGSGWDGQSDSIPLGGKDAHLTNTTND